MQPSRLFVACLLMIALAIPSVLGCSCGPSHPQVQFCNADLVISGTVQEKQEIHGQPTVMSYKIHVNSVKKGEEYAGQLWNTQDGELLVNTTSRNASCGVPWLEVGQHYILTVTVINGKGFLLYCHFHQAYSQLTNIQRRGINGAYSRGCAPQCQIYTCRTHGNCPPTPLKNTTCIHGNSQTHEDCYYHHGFCRPKSSGKCAWKTDSVFDMCLQESNQIV